jgi:hypothetical protein
MLLVLSLFLPKLKNSSCGYSMLKLKGLTPLSQRLLAGQVQKKNIDLLVAMKWCDRKDIKMLSALHSDEIVNNGKCDWKTKQLIMKLKCIVD